MGLSARTSNRRRREFESAQAEAELRRGTPRTDSLDDRVREWIESDAKRRREALDKLDGR